MNEIYNPFVFYPIAICIILFASLVIKFQNIFYSLISAIVVFFLAGIFFYLLGSEYNAVIQIAIYGVAVPIILGLAIMFTNLKKQVDNEKNKDGLLKFLVFLTAGVFVLATIYLILTSYVITPEGFNLVEQSRISALQVFSSFANGIFVRYVWAFELMALILTIIVVGISMYKRTNSWK